MEWRDGFLYVEYVVPCWPYTLCVNYASDPVTKRVLLNGYASDILLSKAIARVGYVLFKSFAQMYVDIASSSP